MVVFLLSSSFLPEMMPIANKPTKMPMKIKIVVHERGSLAVYVQVVVPLIVVQFSLEWLELK